VGPSFPLVVTSYEVVLADINELSRYSWKCLVVDEGHRLKNFNCRLIRELRGLSVENKILLTGESGCVWCVFVFACLCVCGGGGGGQEGEADELWGEGEEGNGLHASTSVTVTRGVQGGTHNASGMCGGYKGCWLLAS
jgi:hypothetical protein